MTPRHLAMGVALVLAAGLVLFGGDADTGVATAVARAPRPASASSPATVVAAVVATPAATAATAARAPDILALEDRARLIGDPGESMGKGQRLFGSQDWNPPPPPAPAAAPPEPAPPPSAPPLPFTYMGKALENGRWEVFLNRSGQSLIVGDKTVIDGTYRVDAIAPPVMTLTYLPLNQVQQLNIGVLE